MKIKDTFDPARTSIAGLKKVISYAADQPDSLQTEISEYVVTERIEDNFERLLSHMQQAMEAGGVNDIGVWVSGFYGSGSSLFTKYLALHSMSSALSATSHSSITSATNLPRSAHVSCSRSWHPTTQL